MRTIHGLRAYGADHDGPYHPLLTLIGPTEQGPQRRRACRRRFRAACGRSLLRVKRRLERSATGSVTSMASRRQQRRPQMCGWHGARLLPQLVRQPWATVGGRAGAGQGRLPQRRRPARLRGASAGLSFRGALYLDEVPDGRRYSAAQQVPRVGCRACFSRHMDCHDLKFRGTMCAHVKTR